MNLDEINALGNILNNTWGHGSTNNKRGATMSIKGHLLGEDKMVLSFTSIINFGEPHERRREFKKMSDDSGSILNAAVSSIKKEFKDMIGRSLKIEQINNEEDYELLNLGQFSGRRDAYYRRKIILRLE